MNSGQRFNFSYIGFSIKLMVYKGKSYWNRWFRGTPILGNLIFSYWFYLFDKLFWWFENTVVDNSDDVPGLWIRCLFWKLWKPPKHPRGHVLLGLPIWYLCCNWGTIRRLLKSSQKRWGLGKAWYIHLDRLARLWTNGWYFFSCPR